MSGLVTVLSPVVPGNATGRALIGGNELLANRLRHAAITALGMGRRHHESGLGGGLTWHWDQP